jgi:hypothetical protein
MWVHIVHEIDSLEKKLDWRRVLDERVKEEESSSSDEDDGEKEHRKGVKQEEEPMIDLSDSEEEEEETKRGIPANTPVPWQCESSKQQQQQQRPRLPLLHPTERQQLKMTLMKNVRQGIDFCLSLLPSLLPTILITNLFALLRSDGSPLGTSARRTTFLSSNCR